MGIGTLHTGVRNEMVRHSHRDAARTGRRGADAAFNSVLDGAADQAEVTVDPAAADEDAAAVELSALPDAEGESGKTDADEPGEAQAAYTRCITASIRTEQMVATQSADGKMVYSYQLNEQSFQIYIRSDGTDKSYTIAGTDENGEPFEKEFDPYSTDLEDADYTEFSALCMYIRQTDDTADLIANEYFSGDDIFEKKNFMKLLDRAPVESPFAHMQKMMDSLEALMQSLNAFVGHFFQNAVENNQNRVRVVRTDDDISDIEDEADIDALLTDQEAVDETAQEDGIDVQTAEQASSQGTKKPLGLYTEGDQVYIVTYADTSTDEDPIIRIGGKEYAINDIDPRNATRAELCALESYMNDTGMIPKTGRMRSYSRIGAYAYNANGGQLSDTKRYDWLELLEQARNTFLGNPATYGQAEDCDLLSGFLNMWLTRRNV